MSTTIFPIYENPQARKIAQKIYFLTAAFKDTLQTGKGLKDSCSGNTFFLRAGRRVSGCIVEK